MPTFIDESGDTGHAADSLPFFRLAAVWIPKGELDGFRASVRALRTELGLPDRFEFKFVQSFANRRMAFLENALRFGFKFGVCSIDKTRPYWNAASSDEQHWATATCVAVDMREVYHSVEQQRAPLRDPVLVDDNGDKSFLNAINRAFRGLKSCLHPNYPMTANARFRNSKPDDIMQLVDMVCGSCGAHLDGDGRCYESIKGRCVGFTTLP